MIYQVKIQSYVNRCSFIKFNKNLPPFSRIEFDSFCSVTLWLLNSHKLSRLLGINPEDLKKATLESSRSMFSSSSIFSYFPNLWARFFLSTHGKLKMFQAQLLASSKTAGNSQTCTALLVNIESSSISAEDAASCRHIEQTDPACPSGCWKVEMGT